MEFSCYYLIFSNQQFIIISTLKLTTILRTSSGTLRLALQIAYAEEWEKITGAWNT